MNHSRNQRLLWSAGLYAACLLLPAPAFAETTESLLARALTCQLQAGEIAGLPAALASLDRSFAKPSQRYLLPSFNRYKAAEPVSAYGYATNDIVLAPDRVMILAPAADRKTIEVSLGLKDAKYAPSSKEVGPDRSIVAYELGSLPGKLLLGCQYDGQAAAAWGSE